MTGILVAFVAGPCDDLRAIRRALGQVLPAAMVPTDYRHYRALPRTGSNKLDRILHIDMSRCDRPRSLTGGTSQESAT